VFWWFILWSVAGPRKAITSITELFEHLFPVIWGCFDVLWSAESRHKALTDVTKPFISVCCCLAINQKLHADWLKL